MVIRKSSFHGITARAITLNIIFAKISKAILENGMIIYLKIKHGMLLMTLQVKDRLIF